MLSVEGLFTLKCSRCHTQYDFQPKETYFEPSWLVEDKHPGPEWVYIYENLFSCECCSNEIEIRYEVWEFPVGVLYKNKIEIKRGVEIKQFQLLFTLD
jgi:hypothetical protein